MIHLRRLPNRCISDATSHSRKKVLGGRAALLRPVFDVKETPDAVVLQADLPGVDEKDVEISVDLIRLIVRGKRETYYACERSYGSFVRSFTMPSGVDTDNVHAEMKNGVQTIKVPEPAESRPKKVELKRGQPSAKA
jgi:HSP20 family protein